MANYDKYDPKDGGFRAFLAADWLTTDLKTVIGVGLNTSGQVVKGAGNTGIKGVVVLTEALKAGDVVDVMTDGEVVDFDHDDAGAFASTAGTNYYAAAADGAVNATSATGKVLIGATVEASRLVVRVGRGLVP